jgi:hypothetical protein
MESMYRSEISRGLLTDCRTSLIPCRLSGMYSNIQYMNDSPKQMGD